MVTEQELQQQYENELALAEQQARQSQNLNYSPTMFGGGQKQNLIEWELDFSQELQDIERLLRCDIIKTDKDGKEDWVSNPDKTKVFLNDLGVNDVLRKLRLLVNKNKVLSNYTIEEIRIRVKMISNEIRCLIYNNCEQYGIGYEDEYKMNNFPSIVLDISSIVEDAYRRAMGGETQKGLNEQRLVNQTEPLGGNNYQMPQQSQKKVSILNPLTWGR